MNCLTRSPLATLGLTGLIIGLATPAFADSSAKKARSLIQEVVKAVGGAHALHHQKDVEYTYTKRTDGKITKQSLERYIFQGEKSWAKYLDGKKEIVQGYNGKKTWAQLDGQLVSDPKTLKRADFSRKTNFYWFAMMHKLLDPGVIYEHAGQQRLGDTKYDLVKMTFAAGIGDVQDIYLLYINPHTKLIDQFLFTILDFGKKDPMLMQVKYKKVNGITLPASRRYTKSDWKGSVAKDAQWNEQEMESIKFNNGFKPSLFAPPVPKK